MAVVVLTARADSMPIGAVKSTPPAATDVLAMRLERLFSTKMFLEDAWVDTQITASTHEIDMI